MLLYISMNHTYKAIYFIDRREIQMCFIKICLYREVCVIIPRCLSAMSDSTQQRTPNCYIPDSSVHITFNNYRDINIQDYILEMSHRICLIREVIYIYIYIMGISYPASSRSFVTDRTIFIVS